jgi:DNA-binding NarL/FixJ family response regulator
MTRTRTALLADAQPVFRAGLAAALGRAGIQVVGEVANATEAVAAALRLRPGTFLVDSDLIGGALLAVSRIKLALPETLVVVFGPAEDGDALVAAIRAGASGYLPRNTTAPGLARAVEAVLDGSVAIPRAAVSALIREVHTGGRQRESIAGADISFTARESRVIALLRNGLGTREIADELGLSPITVRRYLGTAATKVGASNRAALMRSLRST